MDCCASQGAVGGWTTSLLVLHQIPEPLVVPEQLVLVDLGSKFLKHHMHILMVRYPKNTV